MRIREALIQQSPSLALQRAAADEIARLDGLVGRLRAALDSEFSPIYRDSHTVQEFYQELFKD